MKGGSIQEEVENNEHYLDEILKIMIDELKKHEYIQL